MSTRKVAMCAIDVLGDLVEALKSGDEASLYASLEAAITYLACHAQRAHPKRDRQTGRSQLGLEPFWLVAKWDCLMPQLLELTIVALIPWAPFGAASTHRRWAISARAAHTDTPLCAGHGERHG